MTRFALILIVILAGIGGFAAPSQASQATATGAGAASQPAPTGTFYDSLQPGLLGGLLGAGVGVWGGLIGTVGGVCAPRGKARGLVVTLFAIQIAGGLVLLALGIGAFVAGAPWMIGYSFLLPGGLSLLLGVTLFPVMLVRYRQAEMRRIEAEAFRAG